MNKSFHLAKINGMVMQRNYHRIQLDINMKQYSVKLDKEIIFFNKTVKPNTKLFKCIEAQGLELDIKDQFDWYHRDMIKHEPV